MFTRHLLFISLLLSVTSVYGDSLLVDPNSTVASPLSETKVITSFAENITLSANTYYIDPNGNGDYPTIQAAVDIAINGDDIVLLDGTYAGPGNRDVDLSRKAITVRSENGAKNCIIDCQGTLEEFHRAFLSHGNDENGTVIEGLTIINGYQERGGAIHIDYASPLITNCIFRDNTCTHSGGESGGALFASNSEYRAINCLFYRNSAVGDGGAVFNLLSNPTLINCTFLNNSADDGHTMFNYVDSNVSLINCLIYESSNALVNQSRSHLTLTHCNILGGISNYDGPDSTITYLEGNISEDPLFLDADHDNFTLHYDSPCIDTGIIDALLPTNDIRGNARKIDGNNDTVALPDIGAYEMDAPNIPVLFLSQNEFIFDCLESDPDPQSQSLLIWNGGPGEIAWKISDPSCDWLTVTPSSGTASVIKSNVTLSVNSVALPKGTYQCEIIVYSDDVENSPKTVNIALNVTGPSIEVSQSSLAFITDTPDDTPSSQILTITNAGGGTLNWQIQNPTCDWLSLSTDSGSNAIGESTDIELSVTMGRFNQGVYDCSFEIHDENADNSPYIINVRLLIQVEGDIYVPLDYPTIQDAVNNANDGDIIRVLDGIYTGQGNYMINTYGKEITIHSMGGYQDCTIQCETHADSSGFIFANSETNQTVIDGFSIINAGRGGIYCIGNSSPTIRNCHLSNNTAPEANPFGGGLYCRNSSPILERCIIEENSVSERGDSSAGGAGIYAKLSSLIIDRCTIRNNTATVRYRGVYGAGVMAIDSTILVKNSLIVENVCSLPNEEPIYLFGGSGIYSGYSIIDIINCTVSNNTSDSTAGGIYCYSSVISAKNSIISNNSTRDEYEICIEGSDSEYGYPSLMSIASSNIPSDIGIYVGSNDNLHWQQGNIEETPLFVNDLTGDYRISPASPCIDAGINSLVDIGETDIYGHLRIHDGNCDSLELVDIGAYEFNGLHFGDFTGDCTVNLKDFQILSQAWSTSPEDRNWDAVINLTSPNDENIDLSDLIVFSSYWLENFD